MRQLFFYVAEAEVPVTYKAVHPQPGHSQSLLYSFLKGASDSHNLSHALHAAAYLMSYAVKFIKIPARYLADDIIERRLKTGSGNTCHRVTELMQAVAESKLRRNKGQGIACCLGGQGT